MNALNTTLAIFLLSASFLCGIYYSEWTSRDGNFPLLGFLIVLAGAVSLVAHVTLRLAL